MKRHHANILLFFVVCSLLASGCIKEDRDNCDTLQLSFRYFGDEDSDILREKINSIELYLFDHEGNYVKEWTDLPEAVSKQQALLQVNPGDYTVVAVGNKKSQTLMHNRGQKHLDDFQLTHPELINGATSVDGFDDIYLGRKTITVKGGRITQEVLDFECSHHDIIIEVRGYYQNGVPNNLPTILSFTNVTAGTTLKNMPTGSYCDCVKVMEYTGDQYPTYIYNFNVHRYGLEYGFPINTNIELRSTRGEADFSFNVWKYLQDNPSIHLKGQETVIPILIEFTPIGVEIKLPEWYIQDVTPEFGD